MGNKKPNMCATCGSFFSKRSDLVRHERVHTGEKPFKCKVCGTNFSQASTLKTHVRKHTGERPFQCPYCDRSFAHAHRLKSHALNFHISSKLFCSLCKIKLQSVSDFEKHVLSHLSKSKKNLQKEEAVNVSNETDNWNYESHPSGSHSIEIEKSCLSLCKDYCTSTFVCEKIELINNVGKKSNKYTVTQTFECVSTHDKCDDSFCLQFNSPPKNFVCEICGLFFVNFMSLESHIKTHESPDCHSISNPLWPSKAKPETQLSRKRSFTCHICGVFFNSSQQLKVHQRIHTGSRPFSCKVCGMKFTHGRVLEIHMKVHEDDKRMRLCNVCGLSFTSVESFEKHVHLHTNDIKYSDSHDLARSIYIVQEASLNKGLRIQANEERIGTPLIKTSNNELHNYNIVMINSFTAQSEEANSLSVLASSPTFDIKSVPSFQDILMSETSDVPMALSHCDACDDSTAVPAKNTEMDNDFVITAASNEVSNKQIININEFNVDKSEEDLLDDFEQLRSAMSKASDGLNASSYSYTYNHDGDSFIILNGTVVEQANTLPFSIFNTESGIANINTKGAENLKRIEDNGLTSRSIKNSISIETELTEDPSQNGPTAIIHNNTITTATATNNNNKKKDSSISTRKGNHEKEIGREIEDDSKNNLTCTNCPLGLLDDSVVAELCKDGCLDEIVDKSLQYKYKYNENSSNRFLEPEAEIDIPNETDHLLHLQEKKSLSGPPVSIVVDELELPLTKKTQQSQQGNDGNGNQTQNNTGDPKDADTDFDMLTYKEMEVNFVSNTIHNNAIEGISQDESELESSKKDINRSISTLDSSELLVLEESHLCEFESQFDKSAPTVGQIKKNKLKRKRKRESSYDSDVPVVPKPGIQVEVFSKSSANRDELSAHDITETEINQNNTSCISNQQFTDKSFSIKSKKKKRYNQLSPSKTTRARKQPISKISVKKSNCNTYKSALHLGLKTSPSLPSSSSSLLLSDLQIQRSHSHITNHKNVYRKKLKLSSKSHSHTNTKSRQPSEIFPCQTCHLSFIFRNHMFNLKTDTNIERMNTTVQFLGTKNKTDSDISASEPINIERISAVHIPASIVQLQQHRDVKPHKRNTGYLCQFCGAEKSSLDLLNKHLNSLCINKNHTSTVKAVNNIKNKLYKYNCSYCSAKFNRKSSLVKHVRIHSGERPFRCELCSKSFTQRANLQVHMRIHTGERPFSCEKCESTFAHSQALDTHMRFHDKNFRFICSICGKGFVLREALSKHMYSHSHTKEKLYSCQYCDAKLASKSSLNRHMKAHKCEQGLLPLTCKYCPEKFAQMSHLNLHLRSHTNSSSTSVAKCTI